MTALDALLGGLVDYAGLFPPAALDMRTAARAYAEYRGGPHARALGAFVVPASRLEELAEACAALEPGPGGAWPLNALAGERAADDVARALGFGFNSGHGPRLSLVGIETRVASVDEVARVSDLVPPPVGLALEIPLTLDRNVRRAMLAAVKAHGRMAKMRTGGVTPDAIPPARAVAEFIWDCARAAVPFKATAGLHHPVRSERPLTYHQASPVAVMHGFVNVLAAAAIAWSSARHSPGADPTPDVLAVIEERDPSAFEWTRDALRWHGRMIPASDIDDARNRFARGFGSCSFAEPIDDLQTLGWLAAHHDRSHARP